MRRATCSDTRPQIEMQPPTTDGLAMPSKGLKRDSLREDISGIFCGWDMLYAQSIREFRAEPMAFDSQRFRAWSQTRRISRCKNFSRLIVFPNGRDSGDGFTDAKMKGRVDLKEETAKIDHRTHSHRKSNALAFHCGKTNLMDALGFPKDRDVSNVDDVASARTDGVRGIRL